MALEYDNSAFYYFALSFCVLFAVPLSISLVKQLIRPLMNREVADLQARTRLEREKIRQLQKETSSLKKTLTCGFLFRIMITLFLWWAIYILALQVMEDHEIAQFDPYHILDIDTGASTAVIKKAYRKLSLQYHPDRNPGDSVAAQKFMMLAKAYEALTDEVAKANYEKYGNPDGRQALEVSIGLPSFLMAGENQNLVLVIYLMGLVIIIPSLVALWYSRSKKYGENNVMYDTYGFFNYALSEHAHLKLLPEILAGAAEFREIPSRLSDQEDVAKIFKQLRAKGDKGDGQMSKPKYNHPAILKANVLLHAHLLRVPLPVALQEDLKTILERSSRLMEAMRELSCMRGWLQTTMNIIELSQHLTQALWFKDSPLLQLPHFTDYEVKHCASGRNAIRSLKQFIKSDPEDRKGMNKFSQEEIEDVQRACGIFPDVSIETVVGVEDEDQIAVGDLMSVTIRMTRNNVKENAKAHSVYAEHFPFPREERWFFLVGDLRMNKLLGATKSQSQERVIEEKLRFPAPPKPGQYQIDLFVKCDSYIGLDHHEVLKFSVISADELPEVEVHPEDAALDDEPTLFEQVIGNVDDDTDTEEEDNEDENDEEPPSNQADAEPLEQSEGASSGKPTHDGHGCQQAGS